MFVEALLAPRDTLKSFYDRSIAQSLVKYLVKGDINLAITGRAALVNEDFLLSILPYVNKDYSLRVDDNRLCHLLDKDNFHVQKVDKLGFSELGKDNKSVNVIGDLGLYMSIVDMVSAEHNARSTMFIHYADSLNMLTKCLGEALITTRTCEDHDEALERVSRFLNGTVQIVLVQSPDGRIYIREITEIISKLDGSFLGNELIKFDLESNIYYPVNRMSKELENSISDSLTETEKHLFQSFLNSAWLS